MKYLRVLRNSCSEHSCFGGGCRGHKWPRCLEFLPTILSQLQSWDLASSWRRRSLSRFDPALCPRYGRRLYLSTELPIPLQQITPLWRIALPIPWDTQASLHKAGIRQLAPGQHAIFWTDEVWNGTFVGMLKEWLSKADTLKPLSTRTLGPTKQFSTTAIWMHL